MKHNILYSFRRCPYAIRARWALINTNQVVELREVDLKNKPTDLIEISKKGTVPVLRTNSDKVIDESLDIMNWAIINAGKYELLGHKDSKNSQEINRLIEENDKNFKFHLDRFKYASRFNYEERNIHRDAGMDILISLDERLKNSSQKEKPLFLINAKETLADWAIWPFVRQYRTADVSEFDKNDRIKYLRIWLNYFLSHKNYPALMRKIQPWLPGQEPIILEK